MFGAQAQSLFHAYFHHWFVPDTILLLDTQANTLAPTGGDRNTLKMRNTTKKKNQPQNIKNVGLQFPFLTKLCSESLQSRKANTALNLTIKTMVLFHMNLSSIFFLFWILLLRHEQTQCVPDICTQWKARQSPSLLKHFCAIYHCSVKSQNYSSRSLLQVLQQLGQGGGALHYWGSNLNSGAWQCK